MSKIVYETILARINCRNLPDADTMPTNEAVNAVGVRRLGIQEARNVVQDVALTDLRDGGDVTFQATLETRDLNPPDFGGAFVHGKPGERFLYLSWGYRDSSTDEWRIVGRTKITLMTITEEDVRTALQSRQPLVLSVSLTDDKGKTRTASLPKNEILWRVETADG